MKLCYVSGNAPLIFKLMNDMVSRGHEVHWIPMGKPKYLPKHLIVHESINININGNYIKICYEIVLNYIKFLKLIKTISPDIIHAINIKWAGWFSVLSGYKPVIVTAQGQDVMINQKCDMDFLRKRLRKYTITHADAITYGSTPMINDINLWGTPKLSLKYYQGVDLNHFDHKLKGTHLREQYNLKTDIIVFSPRMFTENSNIDIVIKAIPLVKNKIGNVKFIFACHLETNNYSDKMKRLIDSLGVIDDCIILNSIPIDEMSHYYGFSDLVISILTSDGMPATILESMAMKKLLLVSKIETYEEISKGCDNMLFAELRDINSTANGIINGITKINNDIIERAYNWVLDNGNSVKLNDEMENLYKKIV